MKVERIVKTGPATNFTKAEAATLMEKQAKDYIFGIDYHIDNPAKTLHLEPTVAVDYYRGWGWSSDYINKIHKFTLYKDVDKIQSIDQIVVNPGANEENRTFTVIKKVIIRRFPDNEPIYDHVIFFAVEDTDDEAFNNFSNRSNEAKNCLCTMFAKISEAVYDQPNEHSITLCARKLY